MLINESQLYQKKVVFIMSDLAIVTALAKTTLLEIAKQALALGMGLQNAAPSHKDGSPPNPSVQYLFETSDVLSQLSVVCERCHTPSLDDTKKQ